LSDIKKHLVSHISHALTKISDDKAKALEKILSDNKLPFYKRPDEYTQHLLPERGLAILLSKTICSAVSLRGNSGVVLNPEAWDLNEVSDYVRQAMRNFPNIENEPVGSEVYLGGSFWVYATGDERAKALAAWHEAKELCTQGYIAVDSLYFSGHREYQVNSDLFRIWFGDFDSNPKLLESARSVLSRALGGFQQQLMMLSYSGLNVYGPRMSERRENAGAFSDVRIIPDEWGQSARSPKTCILGQYFFDPSYTSESLRNLIVGMDDDDMQVSRGGCVLHEATHMFSNTVDAPLSEDVLKAVGSEERSAQGYGAKACLTLAKYDSAAAVNNADSYRIFCEATVYKSKVRPGGFP
jgi:hypothetical protein